MSRVNKRMPLGVNNSKANAILSNSVNKKLNRSLVDRSGQESLQLSQDEITFINTDLNEVYEISMAVRNVSQKSTKVKIKKPHSEYLSASFDKDEKEGVIAPGLDRKIIVTFNCQICQELKDRIILYSEDLFEIEIPISVHPSVNYLGYNPFIDLGFVRLGSVVEQQIPIQNKSNSPAEIQLQANIKGGKALLQPSCLTIAPKSTQCVSLVISPISNEPTEIEGFISIKPNPLNQTGIQFTGSYCEYSKYIASASEAIQISEIALNPMFGGQKTSASFNIINNTPKNCEFRLIRKKGASNDHEDQGSFLITPQQFGRDDEEKILCFNPTEGELAPYSRVEICCTIKAKIDDHDQQIFCNYLAGKIKLIPEEFKEWSYIIKAHFNDDDAPKNLMIKGISTIPKLSLSATYFKFPDSGIRHKLVKTLKVENLSDRPVPIFLEKSQNYSFRPERFELQKDSTKEVQVTFMPKIIGEMNQIGYLRVADFIFPIKMLGKGIFAKQKNMVLRQAVSKVEKLDLDLSKGVEMPLTEMNGTFLQEQISMINEKSVCVDDNNKNSTINFDISSICLKNEKGKIEEKTESRKRTIKNRHGKEILLDLSKFNPNQHLQEFPGLGKNSQEDRIVTRQLNLNQFRNIPVGPTILNLGQIFVHTPITKTFHICNLNLKPISIQLETKGCPEFEKSSKNIQILPPQTHGGLMIAFEPKKEGPFRYNLQYVINGRHYFQMQVTGLAILPTVILSKSEFRFMAGDDDHAFEKRESFSISNSYPYQVEYCFHFEKESLFKMNPWKGKIGPNGREEIKIVHDFLGIAEGGGKAEEIIKLKIKNGVKLDIKCLSIVPQCHLLCKPSEINFKEVSICKTHEMKFSLRNSSKNFTIFKIVPSKEIQDYVEPVVTKTSLSPDETSQVTLKLHCNKESIIDSSVTVIVRGGRHIVIPVKANVIIPLLRIEGEEVDFGSMPMGGNPTKKMITIVNQSPIAASIELMLLNEYFLQRCLSLIPENSELISISPLKQSRERKAKFYSIKLAKKCKAQLTLQFIPEEVKQYKFVLPFYLSGSNEVLPSLQKDAVCKSLKNRLVADRKLVDFGKIIIEQSLDNLPKSTSFTLKNPQNQKISWWISQKSLQPFSLQQTKGDLEANQEIQIKAFFYNGIPGDFEKQLHFFIDKTDFEPGRPYLKLLVKASANYPEIYFDRPYVILPVVQLGCISKGQFQIINGGYENLNLKHTIAQQYSHINLQVRYINGSNLGIAKKSIAVEVAFKSDKPISFTLKIDFYDHHNRMFHILVSGTADNSLYTINEEEWNEDFEGELIKSSVFLKNYLNGLGFMEDPLYDFPNSLSDNDYEGMQKLLVFMSPHLEKLDRNRPTRKLNPSQLTLQTFEYLSDMIKTLKSEGAFLSEIRPEFLMTEPEFREILGQKAESQRVFAHFKLPSDELFNLQRSKSWIILIYQVLKVYSKVPVKKKVIDFWSVFSMREKTIISWLESSYQSQAMLEEPKTSHELKSLGDGEMLSALITKYTNIKILDQYGKSTLTYKEREKKCKKIIQIFHQIGIANGIRVEDLLRSKPREMLIFLERLYLILPSYLQKGDPIVFSCAIGQSITKSIEIKNPSKYPVTYLAKIEGSKAYVIQNECQFLIEPKQKHEISIKYISNIDISKTNATLTLTGQTSAKFTPSTFIFVLKSQSLGRISEKSIQVSGILYEALEFQVNVKNNFTSDANLAVQIISAKNGKNMERGLLINTPVIKVKREETVAVPFTFLPLCMESHKYFIIFKDQNVGEFQYELTGLVEQPNFMPQPIKFPQTFFTNKHYSVQLPIPQKNELLVKARKNLESMIEKINRKNQTMKKLNSTLGKHKIGNKENEEDHSSKAKNSLPGSLHTPCKPETYSIVLSPHTDMITLKNNTVTLDPEEEENHSHRLFMEVNMKVPVKDAVLHLVMKNSSGTDIRRYKVLVNCVYKPLRYELEMKIPVNQEVTQPIPLINITSDPNFFNVMFSSFNSSQAYDAKKQSLPPSGRPSKAVFSFNSEKELMVGGREQKSIDLSFNPKAQQTYNGLVRVENLTTGQVVEYEVIGIGEEPVAEVHKFQQLTGEQKTYQLKLDPQSGVCSRQHKVSVVRCTLPPQNVKFEKSFWCNGGPSHSSFKFGFSSKFPGLYEGRIHLEDDLQVYAYQLTISVQQNVTGQIKIRAIERVKEAVSVYVEKAGVWMVEHNDPNIEIPEKIDLPSPGKINFFYQAAKTINKQSYILLKNEEFGYLKYLLNVKVEDQPETIIDNLQAELGKTKAHYITIENPDNDPMTVIGNCSNADIFYYKPEGTLTIPPKTVQQIKLVYRPTCLQKESGKIHFTSSNNQKWKYELIGEGLLQQKQEIKEAEAEVEKEIIETIIFTNPFKKPLMVYLFLEQDNHGAGEEPFVLISKTNKIHLNYLEEISIPIKFIAKKIKLYQGRLKVVVNQKIYWRYALNVNTYSKVQEEPRMIRLPSRIKKQFAFTFDLPYLPQNSSGKQLQCDIIAENPDLDNLLRNTCRVVKEPEEIHDGRVTFLLNFLSFRPFSCPFTFELKLEDRCRWIYRGQVDFQVPPPDDHFQMTTQIHKATSVVFRLNNRIKSHAKFKAFLTSGSDMDFSLNPKFGELEPFGREGTLFEVIFAPTQYKNCWQGKIIIETQDSYWSYLVKGSLPHYSPPVGKSQINSVNHHFTSRTKPL